MGLFGGDKKKKPESRGEGSNEEETRRRRARSRRVVAPGGARSGSSKTDARPATSRERRGGNRSPSSRQQAVGPEDERPQAKPKPKPKPASAKVTRPSKPKRQEPRSADDVLELDLESGSEHQQIDLDDGGGIGGGPSRSGDQALYDFLLNKVEALSGEQMEQARSVAQQEGLPADVACTRLGFFTEDQLVKWLTDVCWVPHLKVEKYAIRKKALDTVSQSDAITYGVLPVDKLGSILNLAMVNPLDVETINILQQKTGLDIKKVVASRSEIEGGINKYYGGGVEASDQALNIEQDIPSQRVTQMLSHVGQEEEESSQPQAPAAAQMEEVPVSADSVGAFGDDIIDIDDLLHEEEAIKPVAVQPISISEDEFDQDDEGDLFDATVTATHRRERAAPETQADLSVGPEEADEPMVQPAARRPAPEPQPAVVAPPESSLDDDFDLLPDDDEDFVEPAIDLAAVQDANEEVEELDLDEPEEQFAPAPEPAPARRPAPQKPAARQADRPTPGQEPAAAKPPPAPAPAKMARKGIVDLVAVREEEFQHAISHGKARVFEKWVAIQTRNRILNAIPVDSGLDEVLQPLYEEPTLSASAR
ncbi:MAG: hypothetical protein ACOCXA_00395 [Planctomycetota bacterium]